MERPHTTKEFLDIILGIARERNTEYLDRLDYFIASEPSAPLTDADFSLRSVTDFGGSEGIYSDFVIRGCGKDLHVFTAKTLGETPDDFIKMHVLAASVCLISREYVRTHYDDFNWSGYDVSVFRNGEWVPVRWFNSKKKALCDAKNLRAGGEQVSVRENATRKFVLRHLVTAHRDQRIVQTETECFFFLRNADNDVEWYSASDIEDAKTCIDAAIARMGGWYDADGEFVKDGQF